MPDRRSFLARFQGPGGRRRLLIVAGIVGVVLVLIAISCAVLLVGAELWAEHSMAAGAAPTEVFVEPFGTIPPATDTPAATATASATNTPTPTAATSAGSPTKTVRRVAAPTAAP
jgi:hypothetical protein